MKIDAIALDLDPFALFVFFKFSKIWAEGFFFKCVTTFKIGIADFCRCTRLTYQ